MMNLLEIMQAAQGGNAYSNLAQKFGIAPEQAQTAVQSVLPAISLGLQQQAQSLEGWQGLLKTLGSSQASARHFDENGAGIPDALGKEGQNAIGAMFGSPQVSDAVAQHAAQSAGLPAALMQQMLPVIAAMIVGGLFKGATNAGLGGLLGQAMQGGGLGHVFGQFMGGQAPTGQASMGQAQAGQAQASNIFGTIVGQMLGANKPAAPQSTMDPVAAGLEALKSMFGTGQQIHAQHMDALTRIFGPSGGKPSA